MSFRYDKDNLFKEFDIAKQKDIALSKYTNLEDAENDYYTNRIKFCVDHKELKQTNPSYYENVDINFAALENTYRTTNPRDTFYQIGFGMTYAEKKAKERMEHEAKDLSEKE